MENKVEMTNKLNEMVTGLENDLDAIYALTDYADSEKAKADEDIKAVQEQLGQVNAEQVTATDVETAEKLLKKANSLKEKVQLLEQVKGAVQAKNSEEIAGAVESLLNSHKEARTAYKALEGLYMADVSLNTLEADNKVIQGMARDINNALAVAKRVLIKYGIIKQGERMFKGSTGMFHLDATDVYTDLKVIFTGEALRYTAR